MVLLPQKAEHNCPWKPSLLLRRHHPLCHVLQRTTNRIEILALGAGQHADGAVVGLDGGPQRLERGALLVGEVVGRQRTPVLAGVGAQLAQRLLDAEVRRLAAVQAVERVEEDVRVAAQARQQEVAPVVLVIIFVARRVPRAGLVAALVLVLSAGRPLSAGMLQGGRVGGFVLALCFLLLLLPGRLCSWRCASSSFSRAESSARFCEIFSSSSVWRAAAVEVCGG